MLDTWYGSVGTKFLWF